MTATSDGGFVAVGYSYFEHVGDGDWVGVDGDVSIDATIVKFDSNGNLVWAHSFSGSYDDYFFGVTATSDGGFVAVGYSSQSSFGTGAWIGVEGNGYKDAIIVKFDGDGNVVWKKNFGGSVDDLFTSVTTASDGGFIAVGYSDPASFGTGDWIGVDGKGEVDATIVKFDANGNIVWAYNFGGSGSELFSSVSATSDGGFAAVGYSLETPSNVDAIIVKFDGEGNVIWNTNFGGSGVDIFNSITTTSDGGLVAVGYSESFGTGDWIGVNGKGKIDATIVKFGEDGSIDWAMNFGGSSDELFSSVSATSGDGFVAVGYADSEPFGTGDWIDVDWNGEIDATIMKFSAENDTVPGDDSDDGSDSNILLWVAVVVVIIAICAVIAVVMLRRKNTI